MSEGRQGDQDRRRQRVIAAIQQAVQSGEALGVSAIARASRVDRSFLYRHSDLLAQLHATQAAHPKPASRRRVR
jgi:Family of unknown function (DUF6262)